MNILVFLLMFCVGVVHAVPRLVVLPVDALEAVRLLGGMSNVVGVGQHALSKRGFFPEIANLPSVGRGFSPNLEAIALLEPTTVIAWQGRPGPELERQLEPLGISVLRMDMHVPQSVAENMRILGKVLGGAAPKKAEDFIVWAEHHRNTVRMAWQKAVAQGARPPRVLAEHFSQERVAGPGSALFALTHEAGGHNLAANLQVASSMVDMEWVIQQNPRVFVKSLLITSEDFAEAQKQLATAREEVMNRTAWGQVDAISQNHVYVISADILGGIRWVVGMAALASFFYPEAKLEVDAQEMHEEYLRLFQAGSRCDPFTTP